MPLRDGYKDIEKYRIAKRKAAAAWAKRNPDKVRALSRRAYKKNRNKILASIAEKQAFIRELKNNPCTDCGIIYPHYVMDFDHCRGERSIGINVATAAHFSYDRLSSELDKCELVCANCHRERTYRRAEAKGWDVYWGRKPKT